MSKKRNMGIDRYCPVCDLGCVGYQALVNHMTRAGDETHIDALVVIKCQHEDQRWEGLQERVDYVVCQICGLKAKSLTSHLSRVHQFTSKKYSEQFPGALIRSEKCKEKRSLAAKRARKKFPMEGRTKKIACSSCGIMRMVGWSFAPATHETRCASCVRKHTEAYWDSLEEYEEYVTCVECGYRAENLTSHVYNSHPDLMGCYPGQLVSNKSLVRDKSHLKGKSLPQETKDLMSLNAGRWNKWLTKETDERIASAAESMKGRKSWSKGLTKEDHPSLQSSSEKLKTWTGDKRYWGNGLRVELTREDLEPFLQKNGKVRIGRAIAKLGYSFITIRRECDRLGLPVANRLVKQGEVLERISMVLGGAQYTQEWQDSRFKNPVSGRNFRFDGYFKKFQLVVEFHGFQHWVFPSFYIKDEAAFRKLQKNDEIKRNLVQKYPELLYLEIREDEPYSDMVYLSSRLKALGIVGVGLRGSP